MILTELIINGSLFDLIQTKKTGNLYFTDEEISKIFKGLLSALNYIHEKNIVHRDIKPGNLFKLNN